MEDRKTVDVFPCALVFIDVKALGSPNCKSKNPLSYVRQAICLNKSLLHAGFARLNIFTKETLNKAPSCNAIRTMRILS